MDAFASSSERRALTTSERAKLRKTAKPGTEVQMERRLGVPTVLWAAEPDVQGGTPEQAARRHLGRLAPRFRLSGADLNSARVVSVHDTGRGGVIVKLRQSVEGVPVFREEANVLMTRDLGLVGITGYLSSPDGSSPDFSLSARRAVARAASDLLGSDLQASDLDPRGSRGAYLRFSAAALGEPARAKRVMYRLPGGWSRPTTPRSIPSAPTSTSATSSPPATAASCSVRTWSATQSPSRTGSGPTLRRPTFRWTALRAAPAARIPPGLRMGSRRRSKPRRWCRG